GLRRRRQRGGADGGPRRGGRAGGAGAGGELPRRAEKGDRRRGGGAHRMSEVERAAPDTGAPAIWEKCPGCGEINYKKLLERRLSVCPRCGHHLRLSVEQRLLITVDRGPFRERARRLGAADPLR